MYCDTDETVNLSGANINSAIYVNPYVGRVINGYAVNETETNQVKGTTGRFTISEDGYYHDGDPAKEGITGDDDTVRKDKNGAALTATDQHSLKNGVKHYSIADINKSETSMLAVQSVATSSTDGVINIPNAQAFFVLSLITQSGAGTATSASGAYGDTPYKVLMNKSGEEYETKTCYNKSVSYGTYDSVVCGVTHHADYTHVGTASSTSDDDYAKTVGDTAASTATPYIIQYYTTGSNARCVTTPNGYYDINLTSGVYYALPDSFRGLGSVGVQNTRYAVPVDQFNGNGCTVDEDIYLNRYGNTSELDNYFDKYIWNTTQNYSSYTRPYNANTNTDDHGIGLFDSIVMKDKNSKLYNFTLSGSVNTENYDLLPAVTPTTAVNNYFTELSALAGKTLFIHQRDRSTQFFKEGQSTYNGKQNTWLAMTTNIDEATPLTFNKITENGTDYYTISFQSTDGTTKYLEMGNLLVDGEGSLLMSQNPYKFVITYVNSCWRIMGYNTTPNKFINENSQYGFGAYKNPTDAGNQLKLFTYDIVSDTSKLKGTEIRGGTHKNIHWLATGGVVGWSAVSNTLATIIW